jgi:hypothetical protein
MEQRIELERDRRKLVPRFCTCPPEPTRLRYGPYRIPSPARCDVEHRRFYGDDVADLDDIQAEDELRALVRKLAVLSAERHPVDHEWMVLRRQWLLDRRRRLKGTPPPDERAVLDRPGCTVPAMSEGVPKVRVVVVEVE